MDLLAELLSGVRLDGVVAGQRELSPPWGLVVPETRGRAAFYFLVRGYAWLEFAGTSSPLHLEPGDCVVLPRSPLHVLRDDPESPVIPIEQLIAPGLAPEALGPLALRRPPVSDSREGATTLAFGMLDLNGCESHPVLKRAPAFIHLRRDDPAATPWLEATVRLVTGEAGATGPGARAVLLRLCDVLFLQALRAGLSREDDGGAERLRAAADPRIARALDLIHHQPEQPWTVAEIARQAAMSRSAFAARFTEVVGEPPLHYATRWRMQRASELLRTGRDSLDQVAERVGYGSVAAFARVFKREMGRSPGAYRRGCEPVRGNKLASC